MLRRRPSRATRSPAARPAPSSPQPGAVAIGRRIARFLSAREGATAVEFGLIAMPFLCLVAAIIETALAFFAGQVLDNAVSNASRQLYTGQFQAARSSDPAPPAGSTAQQVALQKFKDALCEGPVIMFDCTDVKVDVLAMADNTDYTPPSPVDPGTRTWRSTPTVFGTQYQSPGSNQIAIVQAAVEFPVFFSFLNPNTLANGKRVLQSTVAFRTEPFQ